MINYLTSLIAQAFFIPHQIHNYANIKVIKTSRYSAAHYFPLFRIFLFQYCIYNFEIDLIPNVSFSLDVHVETGIHGDTINKISFH